MTEEATSLYLRFGPTGHPPAQHVFRDRLDEATWRRELGAQTRLAVTAADALETVRMAWASAAEGESEPPS